jgi:signal transduction histidine kinase
MSGARDRLNALFLALGLMFVGVLALLVVLTRASEIVMTAEQDIALNAAPSIAAIDAAQADLRGIQLQLDARAWGAPGDPRLRDLRIDALRKDLLNSTEKYVALPSNEEERAIQKDLLHSLTGLSLVIDRALEMPVGTGTQEPGVFSDLEESTARVEDSLALASQLDAELAARTSREVSKLSRTLLPAAEALILFSMLAAAATILLTIRSVRRAEAMAERAREALEERAAELEAFSGRVAHDLLSPLATVGIALELAQRRLTMPGDAHTSAAVGRGAATLQRVRRFVSDLLEFARSGVGPQSGARANVREVVGEVAEEFEPVAREAGVDLVVETQADHPVRCSPGVLTALVSNLVQNAIKYIGESENRRVVVRALDLDDGVRVEVEDTGPGLDPDEKDHLFELYVRGRAGATAQGLGLGLATVRRLTESHGGKVGVESTQGHGSKFWFSLPTAA